jgi:hypothetical protein
MAYVPVLRLGSRVAYPFALKRNGLVVLLMRWLKDRPPFSDPKKQDQPEQMLQDIPRFRVTDIGVEGMPRLLTSAACMLLTVVLQAFT